MDPNGSDVTLQVRPSQGSVSLEKSKPLELYGAGRPRQHYRNSKNRKRDHPEQSAPFTPTVEFGRLGVSAPLAKNLLVIGYNSPTPIQEAVIPQVKVGRDVVGQAQTGTGKTAAFGIPLVDRLVPHVNSIKALVMVPTRELAVQVRTELDRLGKFKGLRSVAIYGGQPINRQLEALSRGVQIVVGTPGRLIDHINRGTLRLNQINCHP